MSDSQQNSELHPTEAEQAVEETQSTTRRRRRRVEVPQELDIENDRVMTSEDILVDAADDAGIEIEQSSPAVTRKRTRRAKEEPKPPVKLEIGATIPADVVAHLPVQEEAKPQPKKQKKNQSKNKKKFL